MLAISGGKDGCGKTTTTLGLARALDGGALAVDADWDLPDLHALAGVPRTWSSPDPRHTVERAARRSDGDGPDADATVLPAPPEPGSHNVGRVLARVAGAAEHVLVDCPAGAGPDATTPLRVADAVVLATTPCVAALREAAKAAAMARALETPVVGAVVTRAAAVPPRVEEFLGCPVLGRTPRVDPPVLADRRVARAYADVAATLAALSARRDG